MAEGGISNYLREQYKKKQQEAFRDQSASTLLTRERLDEFQRGFGEAPRNNNGSFLGDLAKGFVGGIAKATDPFSTFMANLIYKKRPQRKSAAEEISEAKRLLGGN